MATHEPDRRAKCACCGAPEGAQVWRMRGDPQRWRPHDETPASTDWWWKLVTVKLVAHPLGGEPVCRACDALRARLARRRQAAAERELARLAGPGLFDEAA